MNIEKIKLNTSTENIYYFQSIDSTNSYLLENGRCGDICLSETQIAGRGRRGNAWISPDSENLYFSLCWCCDEMPKYWSLLGLVIGIAVAETLEDIGLKNHGIKWPNDIFWQQHKMGGILIETIDQMKKVVIGIGLNLRLSKESQSKIDQDVIDLKTAMKAKTYSRDDLIITLINKLNHHLKNFENLDIDNFNKSWNHWDILYGEVVNISHRGDELTGQITGIDSQGRLAFRENNSNINLFFSSADIKLRALNKL